MKKLLTIEEVTYFRKPTEEIEKEEEVVVQTIDEHVETSESIEFPVLESKMTILVNEVKLNENCGKMKVKINKDEFKSLFGPNAKPRKGDYFSITKSNIKFEVKKAKKYAAKKLGKGYSLSLKKME